MLPVKYLQFSFSAIPKHSHDELPMDLRIEKLESGGNLGETLYRNKVKFFKTCKLKFGKSKLEAALKSEDQGKATNSDVKSPNVRTGSERRRSSSFDKDICFFCDLPGVGSKNPLHFVQSFRLDQRVRRCARILSDTILQGKLKMGDMIAQDVKYHTSCLLKLYRNASSAQLEGHFSDKQRQIHGIAVSQLVSFIEETVLIATDTIPVLKLSDLVKLYYQYLKDLCLTPYTRIHTTRFKNRILSQFEDISAHNEEKEVILVLRRYIGEAISTAASRRAAVVKGVEHISTIVSVNI